MKKLLSIRSFVLALTTFICLPFSCVVDDEYGGCGGNGGDYQVAKLNLETYSIHVENGSQSWSLSNSTHQDSLFFLVQTEESTLLSMHRQPSVKSIQPAGNQLFACTPAFVNGKSKINTLIIKASDTIRTLDSIFEPEQNINSIFKVVEFPFDISSLTINEFILEMDSSLQHNPYHSFGQPGSSIYFELNSTIQPIQNAVFEFNFVIDDTQTFRLKTAPLTVR